MTALSAGPVDEDRLSKQCGLTRKEMLAFLSVLNSAGAITVHDAGPVRRAGSGPRADGDMTPHPVSQSPSGLRRWLMHDAPTTCAVHLE
jgi:hypothetical protein